MLRVLFLAFLFLNAFLIYRKRYAELKLVLLYLLFGSALALSIFVFTAPVGTHISARITLLFGPALLCLMVPAFYLANRYSVLMFLLVVLQYPIAKSYVNLEWFNSISNDITDTLLDVEEVNPRALKGVIIEVAEGGELWPLQYHDIYGKYGQVFEGMGLAPRLNRAFTELGYQSTPVWCFENNKNNSKKCSSFQDEAKTLNCSTVNPYFCSAGVMGNQVWLIKIIK
jgi:hypothetical protein